MPKYGIERERAQKGGLPANAVHAVRPTLDPTTGGR
jgi:hypothetical protein